MQRTGLAQEVGFTIHREMVHQTLNPNPAQDTPLYSPDGQVFLVVQSTGALALRSWNNSAPIWASAAANATSHAPFALALQEVRALCGTPRKPASHSQTPTQ